MHHMRTWRGFSPLSRLMISKLCFTILTVISFLPANWNYSLNKYRSMPGVKETRLLEQMRIYRRKAIVSPYVLGNVL